MFVILAVAMIVAFTNSAAIVLLGGLATAFGFLLYVPLLDVLYLRKFTGTAMAWALGLGILAVIVTCVFDAIQYPLNIHSAGWGGIVGFGVAIGITALTRRRERERRPEVVAIRMEMNDWLNDIDAVRPAERPWRRAMWVVAPLWFIFAIGRAWCSATTSSASPGSLRCGRGRSPGGSSDS